MLLIPNATNDLTKSKLFLPAHPWNQQSCLQDNSVRRILYETRARIYNKYMLITQDCAKFRGLWAWAYCMKEISYKQLCWFPGCAGKNNLDFVPSLVGFGISNTCYCYCPLNERCIEAFPTLNVEKMLFSGSIYRPNQAAADCHISGITSLTLLQCLSWIVEY